MTQQLQQIIDTAWENRANISAKSAPKEVADAVEHVISALAEDGGTLRCQHGDRLIVLYGRGVATVEVAPRGAVL